MSRKTAFFNIVREFLIGLRATFPEIHSQLHKLETYIDLGESTMPKLVINEFMKKIGDYHKEILDKNESYFRQMDYEDTLDNTCQDLSVNIKVKVLVDQILRFIGREWDDGTLSDQHKDEIWNHLQSMIVMGALAYDNGKTYGFIVAYASQRNQ